MESIVYKAMDIQSLEWDDDFEVPSYDAEEEYDYEEVEWDDDFDIETDGDDTDIEIDWNEE